MDNSILDALAKRLGEFCLSLDCTIATAESCTGGELAEIITRIPGSSGWFDRGFVSYSNAAKQELLSVPEQTLSDHGAVSEETAISMAKGALVHSHADLGVVITGIAGPDGGSDEKPVGTVCFAWAERKTEQVRSTTVYFDGNRIEIRNQACKVALQGLIDILERMQS